MTKGLFLHRADSIYDDLPEERYQFPKSYLSRAVQFIGDWIVYYEPVKAGKQGYYAVAKVEEIVPDPSRPDMYLALIEPGSYLPFERSVPFKDRDGLVERGVLNDRGNISGRAQAAVRPLSDQDFNRIIARSIPDDDMLLPRNGSYQFQFRGQYTTNSNSGDSILQFQFRGQYTKLTSIRAPLSFPAWPVSPVSSFPASRIM